MLLWLLACTASRPPSGDTGAPATDSAGETAEPLPGDSADTGDTGSPPDDPNGCSSLYDQDKLPAFDLEMSGLDLAGLEADYGAGRKEYHEAELHYEDEVVPVMVRLKGNPSFSWFGEKLQFVISVNEVDPDARFHGVRKFSLDASWYDSTLLRDRLSWWVMRERGEIPAACSNNATLSINGEFYGTYGNIEYFDHEYLERVFGKESAGGTLWKYGSTPKANEEVADYDKMNRFWGTSSVAGFAELGPLDEWVRAWAAETVLGDDDGYVCCSHNFYLYDHPTEGILFLPWDFDDTLDVAPADADPITGYAAGFFQQTAFVTLMADPTWRAAYVDEVAILNARMDPAVILPKVDEWAAQVADGVASDEVRTWGDEERRQTLERLKLWVTARHAFLESWVACERGAPVDLDGDGLDSCSDHDDTTPIAAETCNGIDDDNDGTIDDGADCDVCARHDMDARHFDFCSEPRTWQGAADHCTARGGTLATLSDTESYYMAFFWSWPDTQPWWLADDGKAPCYAWNEGAFSFAEVACGELHPSICAVP